MLSTAVMAGLVSHVLNEFNPLWMGLEVVRGAMVLDRSDWVFIAGSACCLTAAYCVLRPWANSRAAAVAAVASSSSAAQRGGSDDAQSMSLAAAKARSWVLSFVSAPIFLAAGWTSAVGLVRSGYAAEYVSQDSPWHRRSLLVFLAFLALDLVIGSIDYASQVDLLTGWIHHPVYVYLSLRTMRQNVVCGIVPHFIEEVPTLVMAWGKLGLGRSDALFGASYFVLRLVFQAYSVYMVSQSKLDVYRGFTVPFVGVLIIHIYWFSAWTMSMRRRMRKRKEKKS